MILWKNLYFKNKIIMSINKKEDSINNIWENNKLKLEINYIKNKAINAIEYYSLVELLQNNLKSKNYDKFREIFTILYEENNLEMIDILFYNIIFCIVLLVKYWEI